MRGTRGRNAAALAAAAFVASVGVGVAPPAIADVPVGGVGWWTRSPAPPTVPQGGITVGQAPDGEVSVAAIRLSTGEGGATGVGLELTESEGQAAQQAATLQVCTTTDTWGAAAGDPIELAPRPTCPSEPLLLERDDAGVWTADLASLLAGQTGDVSIMIVPGPAPASIPGVADAGLFEVGFEAPVVKGDVAAAPASSSSSGSTSPSFGGSTSSSPSFNVPSSPVVRPSALTPSAPAQSAVLPSAQADATVSSQEAGGGQVSFPVAAVGAETKQKSKAVIVAMVLFSMVVGAAAAGLRIARQRGLFDRLIPAGGSSGLKLPS